MEASSEANRAGASAAAAGGCSSAVLSVAYGDRGGGGKQQAARQQYGAGAKRPYSHSRPAGKGERQLKSTQRDAGNEQARGEEREDGCCCVG